MEVDLLRVRTITAGPAFCLSFVERRSSTLTLHRNLPLGGIVIGLLGFVVRIPAQTLAKDRPLKQKLRQIDFTGFVIFAAACVLFLMGLEYGGTTYPWSSSVVIGLLCGGVAMYAIFVGWSIYMDEEALIPPRIVKDRINIACGLTGFFQSGGIFTLMYYLPIWFQGIKGASPLMSGVMILPTVISQTLSAFGGGWLG